MHERACGQEKNKDTRTIEKRDFVCFFDRKTLVVAINSAGKRKENNKRVKLPFDSQYGTINYNRARVVGSVARIQTLFALP